MYTAPTTDATSKEKRKIRIGFTHCVREVLAMRSLAFASSIALHGCQQHWGIIVFQMGSKAQALKP